jgi:hypothetical protein
VSLLADDNTAQPPPSVSFVYHIGKRYLYAKAHTRPLFPDNETNGPRVWGEGAQSRSRWVKDAFHRHIITGEDCVNPEQVGTKACFHYANVPVPAGGAVVALLRLTDTPLTNGNSPI